VIRCVVIGCGAMASTDATKRSMGTAPVDAPMACGSPPLPGDGQAKLCRMVGDATTMQSLLPVDQRVETMQAFGDLLDDHMMGRLLQPATLRNLRLEFDKYRPMLDVLNGRRSAGRDSGTMTKDRVQVEHAAGVVYDWLCYDGGAVLSFLDVLSSAGRTSYSAGFLEKVRRFSDAAAAIDPTRLHHGAGARLCSQCGCDYRFDVVCSNGCDYRFDVVCSKLRYKSMMVARLCLEDCVVGLYSLMLDDCAATRIDDDSSGEFGPGSVVDGLLSMWMGCLCHHRQLNAVDSSSLVSTGAMASAGAKKRTMGTDPVEAPMAHGSPPLPVGAEPMQALLPVSQLNAGGVGGSSMESQSRGAMHVHCMAFASIDSYRQGIAGSRHAETLSMGGTLNEPTERRSSLRRYEHVAAQVLFPSAGSDSDDSVQ
jgi:hypothetical protein